MLVSSASSPSDGGPLHLATEVELPVLEKELYLTMN